jgi:hypothetical protein
MAVGDSKWVPVAFFFFMMCFRIVELVVQYMMYGAINLHDTKRICLLIKWQLGMFLFGYLVGIVLSFVDEDGKPAEAIGSFVIGACITAFWFWYLNQYCKNVKILQEKGLIAQAPVSA